MRNKKPLDVRDPHDIKLIMRVLLAFLACYEQQLKAHSEKPEVKRAWLTSQIPPLTTFRPVSTPVEVVRMMLNSAPEEPPKTMDQITAAISRLAMLGHLERTSAGVRVSPDGVSYATNFQKNMAKKNLAITP